VIFVDAVILPPFSFFPPCILFLQCHL
jgi:hypothetical protein